MHEPLPFLEGFKRSGDAVVETDTESEDEIRFLHQVIRCRFSMHAEHAERMRMIERKRSHSEKSIHYRNGMTFGKPPDFGSRPRKRNSVTGDYDRTQIGIVQDFFQIRDL